MKKNLSRILCLVLVIACLSALALTFTFTSSAAGDYSKVTDQIAVGDTITLVYENKKMELDGISTTSTKYGMGVSYTGAPAGKYPLTVESGAGDGTFAFKTVEGKYLCWKSGNTLNVEESVSNNSSWTVSFDTNGNAVITNAKDSARSIRWNASSPRFACYTSGQTAIQIYRMEVGGCAHENTEDIGEYVAPTCTSTGMTAGKKCMVCSKVIEEQEEISTLDHNYVDGKCSECGATKPSYFTIDLTAQGYTNAQDVPVISENGVTIKFTNAKWYDSGEAVRLYNDGSLAIACGTDQNITKIVLTFVVEYADTTLSSMTVEVGTYTKSSLLGTWVGSSDSIVFKNSTGSQRRLTSIEIHTEDAGGDPTCEHTNREPVGEAKAPTCTEDGITAGEKCADCNIILKAQEVLSATGHNFVNGICDVCGEAKRVTTGLLTNIGDLAYGDVIVIVGVDDEGTYAMGNQSGNNCPHVVITSDGEAYLLGEGVLLLTVVPGLTEGTYALATPDGKYLCAASSSSNYLRLEDSVSANGSWTISVTEDGIATIKSSGEYSRNWIRYNKSSDIFSCYESGQDNVSIYKVNAVAKFDGAQVTIGSDLSIKYSVNTYGVYAYGYTVKFTMGETVVEVPVTLVDGKYVAKFNSLAPHRIGENITAELMFNGSPVETMGEYSIKTYLYSIFNGETSSAALKTLVSDLLVYCDQAQKYVEGYEGPAILDDAVTLTPSTVTPNTDNDIEKPQIGTAPEEGAKFTVADVWFGYNNKIRVEFTAESIDGVTVTIKRGDGTAEIAEIFDLGNGVYTVYTQGINATDFNTVYTFAINEGGAETQTLTFSLNAFARTKYVAANGSIADGSIESLSLALYRYGKSAEAYAAEVAATPAQ